MYVINALNVFIFNFSNFEQLKRDNEPEKAAQEYSKFMNKFKVDLTPIDFKIGRRIFNRYFAWKRLIQKGDDTDMEFNL